MAGPRAEVRAARAFRSTGSPSVVAYWSARAGVSVSTAWYAAAIPAASKSSGAGSPPAKLITSGRAVTARMSRTGEPPIARARAASGGRGTAGVSVTVMADSVGR